MSFAQYLKSFLRLRTYKDASNLIRAFHGKKRKHERNIEYLYLRLKFEQ
jgi:hypothetical protein